MTTRLEDLKTDAQVRGLVGREAVRIITAQMMGKAAQVVYRDGQGTIDTQILFRDKEAELEIISGGRNWRLRTITNHKGCSEHSTTRSYKTHA